MSIEEFESQTDVDDIRTVTAEWADGTRISITGQVVELVTDIHDYGDGVYMFGKGSAGENESMWYFAMERVISVV